MGFLQTGKKAECFGCEACVQACGRDEIHMCEDAEGFRYPKIESSLCISCGACEHVCPYQKPMEPHAIRYAFGGYQKDALIRQNSTSGGAFSAIADVWCDENDVIFGASAEGFEVAHTFCVGKTDFGKFRKSKYSQSKIGSSYAEVRRFLKEGKKVLFSGTPCQIAGLKKFLGAECQERLLTVEVICEGIPSPKFLLSYQSYLKKRYGCGIRTIDYRNKDKPRWDFQVMKFILESGRRIYADRWFNPFYTIWSERLMSRPSCYGCPFTAQTGQADIALADLWGVHQYCPELYGKNKGASLVLCSTEKGAEVFSQAQKRMFGHDLDPEQVLMYQKRLRRPIAENPQREAFMKDMLQMDYQSLCQKWFKPPLGKLLLRKYVWGNRQNIFVWNVLQKIKSVGSKKRDA